MKTNVRTKTSEQLRLQREIVRRKWKNTWWTGWRGLLCCKSSLQLEILQSEIGQLWGRRPCDLLYGVWPTNPVQMSKWIQAESRHLHTDINNWIYWTFRFRGPKRADLASTAAYVSQRPDETCWTKHMDSPYLISGIPMPSTSLFCVTSIFSCSFTQLVNFCWCYVDVKWTQ